MIDLHAVRADTAGCEGVVHLNNAGSSLPPRPVVDAVVDYLREEELTGGYETAAARVADLDAFYTQTASFIGAGLNEVAFTSSASDAWWRAFMSVKFEKGDKILVSRSEFQANAYGWLRALEQGIDVEVVPKLGPTVFLDGRSATWTGAKRYELADGAQRFEFGEHSYAGAVTLRASILRMCSAIGSRPSV